MRLRRSRHSCGWPSRVRGTDPEAQGHQRDRPLEHRPRCAGEGQTGTASAPRQPRPRRSRPEGALRRRLGERAEGHEGDALAPILDRVHFVLPELASIGADQGFAAERVWADAAERRITAYIPPQPTMLPRDERGPRTNAQRLVSRRESARKATPASGPIGDEWPTPRASSPS